MFNNKTPVWVDAERNIIAICLNESKIWIEVIQKLKINDFYYYKHKIIFNQIKIFFHNQEKFDLLTLSDALKNADDDLLRIGGRDYIHEIYEEYLGNFQLDDYIQIVLKHSRSKKLLNLSRMINDRIEKNTDTQEILFDIEELLTNIYEQNSSQNFVELNNIAGPVFDRIRELSINDRLLSGIDTGFDKLNDMTLGLQKGDFIVLAGRPSMGKTAFALNIAYHAATKNNLGCVVFVSLEMPKEQLVQRMLSLSSQVSLDKIRAGGPITNHEWSKLKNGKNQLERLNILINDSTATDIINLEINLKKIANTQPINLIVIDYLQLISSGIKNIESRQQEVSTISRFIKLIARKLNVPVLCLSQLSRLVEKREDKRPIMSDLRDSGAIEQDADLIMFMYREEYYRMNKNEENNTDQENLSNADKTELIIAKHRNGSIGTIDLMFYKRYGSFTQR